LDIYFLKIFIISAYRKEEKAGPAPGKPTTPTAIYLFFFPSFSSPSSIKQKYSINQNQTLQHPESLAQGKPPNPLLLPQASNLPAHQLVE
jgi:hypothetical protein